ncbi:MAG: nucleotidyltransferase family protein [Clostridia bacterium]|nr:nucleotidyltransferase family protein [Clostridia bacterium]
MRGLTKEQKILLNLAAMSVSKTPSSLVLPKEELDGVDWQTVMGEALAHTISLATYDAAAVYKEYIPEETCSAWKMLGLKALKSVFGVSQAQSELVKILEENGVRYAILKGTSAAAYYPKPDLRALGDVDFLIDPNEKEEIGRLLETKGYEKSHEEDATHIVFQKPKAYLEMHLKVAGVPDGEKGERLREFFKNALAETVRRRHGENAFNGMDDVHHGVVLLLHMQHHMFSAGFGLRHLCDWAAYVAKTQNEPFWTEKLIPLFKETGLMKYAAVVTKICARYLHVSCPDWAVETDEALCEELICDILSSGNFGRKNEDRAKSAILIAKHGEKKRSAFGMLAYKLHVSILYRYPIVKKVWILYPFVYAWKALRNLFFILIGKRASIGKIKPEAQKRQKIYEKLQVFEPNAEEK